MSTRAKGGRTRRKIQKFYKTLGYIVENVEFGTKWSKSTDLFSDALDGEFSDKGFDLIGLCEESVAFIQCKTNTPAVRKYYKEFAKKYASDSLEVIVATWIDRKGLRIQKYYPDGEIEDRFVDSKEVNTSIKNNLEVS